MPKTKLQNVFFTILMAFLMVYAMICYNISLNIGGMTNQVFLMAFGEMKIMWPAAIILEFFVVEKLASMLAFRIVSPQDKPIFITLAISSMIVCLMCPMMSFIATLLFKNAGSNFIAVWFQTTVMNFWCRSSWTTDFQNSNESYGQTGSAGSRPCGILLIYNRYSARLHTGMSMSLASLSV